jgi:hypothetical protein
LIFFSSNIFSAIIVTSAIIDYLRLIYFWSHFLSAIMANSFGIPSRALFADNVHYRR